MEKIVLCLCSRPVLLLTGGPVVVSIIMPIVVLSKAYFNNTLTVTYKFVMSVSKVVIFHTEHLLVTLKSSDSM